MSYVNNSNEYLPGVIFIPSTLEITAITQTYPMQITCSINVVTQANTYIPGMLVRLFVPNSYGMYQANNLTGQILSVSGLTFTLNIDAQNFSPFVVPPAGLGVQPATMSPAGSQNLAYGNNTSQVGFQPLNNIGN